MKQKIQGVLFDFGGVLTLPQNKDLFDAMVRYARISHEGFARSYAAHRFEFDRGVVDRHAYWRRVYEENQVSFNRKASDNLTLLDIKSWTAPNEPVIEWASRLRDQGVRTGVVSNMPADYVADIRRTSPWLDDFEPLVFSGLERQNKPEKAIFLTAISRLALPKSDILFIDDTPENVSGAERAGLPSVHYTGVVELAQLIAELYDLPPVQNEAA